MVDVRSSLIIISIAMLLSAGCVPSDFAGSAGAKKERKDATPGDKSDDDEDDDDAVDAGDTDAGEDDDIGKADDSDNNDQNIITGSDIASLGEIDIVTSEGTFKGAKCSADYEVPGRANPFLAGVADETSVSYNRGRPDKMPDQGPILVVPKIGKCIKAGNKLHFEVAGTISHGAGGDTSADGRTDRNATHEKGGILGKSDYTAPFNSLLGVFLSDGDPSTNASPGKLDFSSQPSRDYTKLEPLVGQIFFIGDGKGADGKLQTVIVPNGAKRLYFGISDSYEWNNNSGQLRGAILIQKN